MQPTTLVLVFAIAALFVAGVVSFLRMKYWRGAGLFASVLLPVFVLMAITDDPKADAAAAMACRADPQCFAKKNTIQAAIACRDAITSQAKFKAEWMDDGLSDAAKFATITTYDLDAGTLLLTGDGVRFQNAFGSSQRMKYACTYDAGTGQATSEIEPF